MKHDNYRVLIILGEEYVYFLSFLQMIVSYFVRLKFLNVINYQIFLGNTKQPQAKLLTDRKLYFSRNTRFNVNEDIHTLLGAQVMTECEKYLRLPMVDGKLKVGTFKEIQERITKRVMGWKENHISKDGWELLIKTVSQSILMYSTSIFKIPKTLCDDINSIPTKYWWGQIHSVKIHQIKWSMLCIQKK